jgi:hypothetical protein
MNTGRSRLIEPVSNSANPIQKQGLFGTSSIRKKEKAEDEQIMNLQPKSFLSLPSQSTLDGSRENKIQENEAFSLATNEQKTILENSDKEQVKKIQLYAQTKTLQLLQNALTHSTLHRLGRVFENESKIMQIMIGLFFLASTGCCVYYVIQTIIFLAEHNIVISLSIINETPSEFPGKNKNVILKY